MLIDSIKKGLVLDHITAGKSMDIYNFLGLDKLECSVAIIKNVKSNTKGRKDIIKVEDEIDLDLDILGYIDPNITINIIENEKVVNKKHIKLPEKITNVVKCKNPRCITSIEQEINHIFVLSDSVKRTYRCVYCEQEHK